MTFMHILIDFLIPAASAAPAPAAPQSAPPNGDLFTMGLLFIMFIMFYFLLIRPQRKRQKEHEQMQQAISKGDEVATHAGILGKVKQVDDQYIILKVSDTVELKFQKSAVSVILPKGTIKEISS